MTDRFASSKNFVYCVLAVMLSSFVLVAANFNLFDPQPNLAMFGMLGLLLVFLSRPLIKERPDWRFGRAIDVCLMLLTVVVFGYIFVQSEQNLKSFWVDGILLGDRAGNEKPLDFLRVGILFFWWLLL